MRKRFPALQPAQERHKPAPLTHGQSIVSTVDSTTEDLSYVEPPAHDQSIASTFNDTVSAPQVDHVASLLDIATDSVLVNSVLNTSVLDVDMDVGNSGTDGD